MGCSRFKFFFFIDSSRFKFEWGQNLVMMLFYCKPAILDPYCTYLVELDQWIYIFVTY